MTINVKIALCFFNVAGLLQRRARAMPAAKIPNSDLTSNPDFQRTGDAVDGRSTADRDSM
jgi:hypothetical protein